MFVFKNYRFYALILFLINTLIVPGEDTIPLHLKNKLLEAENDTVRINILLDLTKQNRRSDIKLANKYARQALELSNKARYYKGIATSNFYMAQIFVDFDFEFSQKLAMNALNAAERIKDSLLTAKIKNNIGHLKNNMGEYESALDYFQSSLQYFLNTNDDSAAAANYNNMAISYKNLSNDSLAMAYYFKAAEINESHGNNLWLASNYYNIGIDFLDIDDTANGLHYLEKSHFLAEKYTLKKMFPFIYVTYGRYYLGKNDYQKAKLYAQKSLRASREQWNRLQEKEALNLLKDIYHKSGKTDSAFIIQEKVISIDDSINKHQRLKELDLLDMQHQFEEERSNFQIKIELLEAKNAKRQLRDTLFFGLATTLILILILLYILQKNRLKRKSLEEETIRLENEKLTNDIEYKNKELALNVMYLMKKNEFISDISKKLQSIKSMSDDDRIVLSKIVNDLDKNASKDLWLDFETRFKEIYGDFYKKLNTLYPTLTPNELKLCAFLKLNMSSKEISSITFQSLESLKVARHRLRKKLGLKRADNIVSFLNQI